MIRGRDRRFRGVEDTAMVQLRFPGDMLASFTTSFAASDSSVFQVWGTKGSVRLEQAYEMIGEKTLKLEELRSGKPATRTCEYSKVDQFAPLLAHFSDAVRRGRQPQPSGEEGLADIRVHEAIVKSARSGRPVALARRAFKGPRLGSLRAQRFPAHREPDYVNASPPSRE
jgi:glucose-fructose oxidoreductase